MSLRHGRHDLQGNPDQKVGLGHNLERISPSRVPLRSHATRDPQPNIKLQVNASSQRTPVNRWPPYPVVEDEAISACKEYLPLRVSSITDDVRERGTIDQQPLIMSANTRAEWDAESSADSDSSEPKTQLDLESNGDRRFVLLGKDKKIQTQNGEVVSDVQIQIDQRRRQKRPTMDTDREISHTGRKLDAHGKPKSEPVPKPGDSSTYDHPSNSLKQAFNGNFLTHPNAVAPISNRYGPSDTYAPSKPSNSKDHRERRVDMHRNMSSHPDLRSTGRDGRQSLQPPLLRSPASNPNVPRPAWTSDAQSAAIGDSNSNSDISPDNTPGLSGSKQSSQYSFSQPAPPTPMNPKGASMQPAPHLPRPNSSTRPQTSRPPPRPDHLPNLMRSVPTQAHVKVGYFSRSSSNTSQMSVGDTQWAAHGSNSTPLNISSNAPPSLTPIEDSKLYTLGTSNSAFRTSSSQTTPTSPHLFGGSTLSNQSSLRAPSQTIVQDGYNMLGPSKSSKISRSPSRDPSPEDSHKEQRRHHMDAPGSGVKLLSPILSNKPVHGDGSFKTSAKMGFKDAKDDIASSRTGHLDFHEGHSSHYAGHANHRSTESALNDVKQTPKRRSAIPEASNFFVERPDTRSKASGIFSEAPLVSVTTSSDQGSGATQPQKTPKLIVCPRPHPTAGFKDWSTLQGQAHVNICPKCRIGLEIAGFQGHFLPSPPKAEREPTSCDLSVPWVRMAWLLVLQSKAKHTEIVNQVTQIFQHEAPCPGKNGAVRNWYGIPDPVSDGFVSNFDICPNCVKCLQIILPNLRHAFRQKWPTSVNDERSCDLRTDSRRFPQYVDLLEHISIEAEQYRREPNLVRFSDLARYLTSVRECQEDDQLVEERWHFMPQLPDFTVCEECYSDVILPSAKAGSELSAQFYHSPQRIPHDPTPVSCQLYSTQMRALFRHAAKRNDYIGLRHAALQRVNKERELQARHTQIVTWPEEQRMEEGAKLIAEWRRWA